MKTKIPEGVEIHNKWPQMLVTGKSLTIEQAKDIILRTDSFFLDGAFSKYGGGNNHEWGDWARSVLGTKEWVALEEEDRDKRPSWGEMSEALEPIRKKLGHIRTEYVHNTWASSCFIGGPHGWCHPDGRIYYDDNIGKWPSISAVIEDWEKLVEAFPYIEVAVTLFDGEDCEEDKKPITSFVIKDGVINFTDQHDAIHYAPALDKSTEALMQRFAMDFNNPLREQGLPDFWIEDLGKVQKPLMQKALKKLLKSVTPKEVA
jgi:hypothetical protein